MSNTDVKAGGKRREAKVRGALGAVAGRAPSRRLLLALLLSAFALALSGCRMDMQDQPRYEPYEPGERKFFPDGASSRPLVENTVPRSGAGASYRDREDYFYSGKTQGQPGAGPQTGSTSGGVGTAAPDLPMSMAGAALSNASQNVRGNVAGGIPGAREAAATGGPDVFPIVIDRTALERGRERFQIYCAVCHGFTGEGDGMIVRRGFRRPPSYYDDRLQENTTPASHFFDVITNGWGAMPDYAAQVAPEDRWKIIAYIRALQLSRKLKMGELPPDVQQKVLSGAAKQGSGHEGGARELQSPQTGGTSPQVEGNH